MIVLDTDRISALQHQHSPAAARLRKRLGNYFGPCATTIVTVEEQMRGWLAVLNRTSIDQQVQSYALRNGLFSFFSAWHLYPFDEAAAQHFTALRQHGLSIGSDSFRTFAGKMRNRRASGITALAVLILLLCIGGYFGSERLFMGPPAFSQDFVGWHEEVLLKELGQPDFDSRQGHDWEDDGSYILGWYHGVGRILSVTIRGGKVLSFYRASK